MDGGPTAEHDKIDINEASPHTEMHSQLVGTNTTRVCLDFRGGHSLGSRSVNQRTRPLELMWRYSGSSSVALHRRLWNLVYAADFVNWFNKNPIQSCSSLLILSILHGPEMSTVILFLPLEGFHKNTQNCIHWRCFSLMHYSSKYLLILSHIHSIFNRFIDKSPFFFTTATCNGVQNEATPLRLWARKRTEQC